MNTRQRSSEPERVVPIERQSTGEHGRGSDRVPSPFDSGTVNASATSPGLVSHWLLEVDAEAFPPPMALPAQAEVVIIGGGLMGVSTAYWLARSGINVLLLEAHQLAWGATGRNAGMMLAGAGPLENPALVRSVLHEEGIDAEYAAPGHLALASSAEIWDKIHREVAQRKATSTPVYALDHSACEDLLAMRINTRFLGGRWFPGGGMIHPIRFVYGLAHAALRRGASLVTQTSVLEVSKIIGQDSFDILTSRGRMQARQVVFACNSHIGEFLPDFREVITAVRGQVLSTQPLPQMFRIGLAVDWGTVYWRQTSAGTIVLGGYRNLDPTVETGSQELLNPRIQDALTHFLPDAFPGFPALRVAQRWAGTMDYPVDGKPIIGALPHAPDQWIIAGFGGHGMPAGLGAGKAIAEAIATGRAPATLDAFNPHRFKKEG